MSDVSALMLRAISDELKERIIPNLTLADSIERATLATQVLEHLASDIDTLAQTICERESKELQVFAPRRL